MQIHTQKMVLEQSNKRVELKKVTTENNYLFFKKTKDKTFTAETRRKPCLL